MLTLGIETSCDETAVAVVTDGRDVLSNVVASSLNFHKRHGGVIPEIASRKHLEAIIPVLGSALKEAASSLENIRAVCVTSEPGLSGSLLVGSSFARALSFSSGLPLISVNHVHSHVYSPYLGKRKISFPFIGFVASGGHTDIFFVKGFNRIELLGSTLDDAAGEAFDKVARIIGLGYPGGPRIERLASVGDPEKIKFSCARIKDSLNFSFSGIKTAVLYYLKGKKCGKRLKADISASFQKAVVEVLIEKAVSACKIKKVNTLAAGGGVLSNNYLRQALDSACRRQGINLLIPAKDYCLDNAAMVAGLGFHLFKRRASC